MIVNTFANCVQAYRSFNQWDPEYDLMREQFLASFPASVIVEGDYSELDMAVNWCLANIGEAAHHKHLEACNGQRRQIPRDRSD